jgi:2',3'-cyclic-nucleotide 2'-phosphodiesterase (5'-nucleotidase family)
VVAVTHQDMPADERMAREVPGIQLVIGGHEHDPLENVVGETLITKAGADGVFVVRVDLQVTRDGKVLARQHRFIPITPELPEDPAMAALVARYQSRLSEALDVGSARRGSRSTARNAALRTSETNAGNLVTDVMRARLQADAAIMNGGGIRGNQLVPAGPLTRRDINALLPFLNVLVMLEVPGKVLLEVLERSVSVYRGSPVVSSRSRGSASSSIRRARPASGWCGWSWAASRWTPSGATSWRPTATRPEAATATRCWRRRSRSSSRRMGRASRRRCSRRSSGRA